MEKLLHEMHEVLSYPPQEMCMMQIYSISYK